MDTDFILEEDFGNPEDKIKKISEKLKKCESEKQEYLTGWQRAKADFINTRREEEENKKEFTKFCEKNLILEILNILDSFDRLLLDKNNFEKIDKNLQVGVENIYTQLMDILKKRGVEIIESKEIKLNPKEHESVLDEKVDSKDKDDIILDEIRKGYKMNGVVIRPAQVKIGKYYE